MEKCEFHDMYIRSTVNLRTILYDIHSERSTVTIIIKDNSYEITMFIVLRDKTLYRRGFIRSFFKFY